MTLEQEPCQRCGTLKSPGEWCRPCINSGRSDRHIIETALRDGLYQGIKYNDPTVLAERVHDKLRFFDRLPDWKTVRNADDALNKPKSE